MSTLVVYYSSIGETRRVADAIAQAANADAETIGEAKSGGGQMGFFEPQGMLRHGEPEPISASHHDPAAYDIVALGTPAVGDHVADAVRSYISMYKDRFKQVAFFAVDEGEHAERVFREMEQLCGRSPIATMAIRPGEAETAEQANISRFAESLTRH